MNRLNEIHEYLISKGAKEEDLKKMDGCSVYLSMEIMEYAHRNQKRENGEEYANHPSRCMQEYRELVGIVPDDPFCIDKDLMYEFEIPYDGVQEVCLLHDVIEDSDFTIEEVEGIFDECSLENYFNLYIKQPLVNVTHIKSMDYLSYIKICMEHSVSAIVKMMDLQDNLHVLSLVEFNEKNYERASRYLQYLYLINVKYRFIENAKRYKCSFAKEK